MHLQTALCISLLLLTSFSHLFLSTLTSDVASSTAMMHPTAMWNSIFLLLLNPFFLLLPCVQRLRERTCLGGALEVNTAYKAGGAWFCFPELSTWCLTIYIPLYFLTVDKHWYFFHHFLTVCSHFWALSFVDTDTVSVSPSLMAQRQSFAHTAWHREHLAWWDYSFLPLRTSLCFPCSWRCLLQNSELCSSAVAVPALNFTNVALYAFIVPQCKIQINELSSLTTAVCCSRLGKQLWHIDRSSSELWDSDSLGSRCGHASPSLPLPSVISSGWGCSRGAQREGPHHQPSTLLSALLAASSTVLSLSSSLLVP